MHVDLLERCEKVQKTQVTSCPPHLVAHYFHVIGHTAFARGVERGGGQDVTCLFCTFSQRSNRSTCITENLPPSLLISHVEGHGVQGR